MPSKVSATHGDWDVDQTSEACLPSPLAVGPIDRLKAPSKFKWMSLVCTFLHALLVALHVILLIICVHHYEHSITADVTPFSTIWAPVLVNVVSQVFATVSASFIYQNLSFPEQSIVDSCILLSLYLSRRDWLCVEIFSRARLSPPFTTKATPGSALAPLLPPYGSRQRYQLHLLESLL